MAKAKKKKVAVEMTLWDVILSYPDLHDPKPYKGKIYYRTDVLLEEDHPQLADLRNAIKKVRVGAFGADKTEWTENTKKRFIQDGNEREDSAGYKDRLYITASTQTPVPVVNVKGKEFNPQMVKGGMFANVAIRVSAWEFDGDEGISIYLQGVQIDTSKPSLNFGGGKSVQQMFSKGGDSDDSDEDMADDEIDEDDLPRSQKSKRKKAPVDDEQDDSDDVEESDGDEEEDDASPKKRSASKRKNSFSDDDED